MACIVLKGVCLVVFGEQAFILCSQYETFILCFFVLSFSATVGLFLDLYQYFDFELYTVNAESSSFIAPQIVSVRIFCKLFDLSPFFMAMVSIFSSTLG